MIRVPKSENLPHVSAVCSLILSIILVGIPIACTSAPATAVSKEHTSPVNGTAQEMAQPAPTAEATISQIEVQPAQVSVNGSTADLPTPTQTPEAVPILLPDFDPNAVSAEQKTATITDIKVFIENLNRIIQYKDYDAWLGYLTEEYIAYYSDPRILAQISEYPVLKRAGIKLNSLKDYFIYVVYPSRQNDRVDDIEYIGEQRVKAITISPKGDRQILYNLVEHDNFWKIGIGR